MTEKDAATLSRLVTGCREQMEGELVELVEELGPSLLQEIAARTFPAREPERRIAAATLKLALGAHWGKVAPALKTALASRTVVPAQPGLESREIANLKLLSDAEESILIASNEALDRLTTACRDETNPLERRVSYLVLRSAMQPGDASFRLATLWPCLSGAFCEITPDTGARILLLKTVGERLATEMPQLFRVVNEALIDADILPRLKRSYRDTTPVDAHEVAAETAKVATTLDRLVKARTKEEESTGKPGSGAGSQTLFELAQDAAGRARAGCSRHPCQRRAHGARQRRRARRAPAGRRHAGHRRRAVRPDLQRPEHRQRHEGAGGPPAIHGAQGGDAQPALLRRPQPSGAALPGQHFDRRDPLGQGWSMPTTPSTVKLLELVNKVQVTYDGDMAVFDAANAELDAFLAEREKIEEQQDRELADAVHAREEEIRLTRAAQMRAQRTANQCIARVLGPAVPGEIEEFLRSYWRDVVQGRISRSGEDGAPTTEALQTAVALILAVTPKHDPTERKRHAAALPGLLKRLNAGFDEIGTSPTERKSFMDTLADLQYAALRAEKRAAATPEAAAAEKPRKTDAGPTLQVSHATGSGVRVQDISLANDAATSARKTRRIAPTCAACGNSCAATGWTSSPPGKPAASA
jgi:hypothetical protein